MSQDDPDFSEFTDVEMLEEYARRLAHQLRIMLARDRAYSITLQYLSRVIDENHFELDDHCRRFVANFGKAMQADRPLEHIEADCELLNFAFQDRIANGGN